MGVAHGVDAKNLKNMLANSGEELVVVFIFDPR